MAAHVWQFFKKLWDLCFNHVTEFRTEVRKIEAMPQEKQIEYLYEKAAELNIKKSDIETGMKELEADDLPPEEIAKMKESFDLNEAEAVPTTKKSWRWFDVKEVFKTCMIWLWKRLNPIAQTNSIGPILIAVCVLLTMFKVAFVWVGYLSWEAWAVRFMFIAAAANYLKPHIFNKAFWEPK
jgi:hypothetical protein